MEVIYVSSEEHQNIIDGTVTEIDELNTLKNSGIYVDNESVDDKALAILKQQSISSSGVMDIMYLILTQKCNLKCSYCFLENNPQRNQAQSSMTIETAKKAIDKFVNKITSDNRDSGTIIFYGGEPLLKKDVFFEAVCYALTFSVRWSFSIITNGTLIDLEIVKFCKEKNITVGLSLDGPKELHDLNRTYRLGDGSSYDDCMKAKKILDEYGCHYGLSLTLSKEAIANEEVLIDWLMRNHRGDVYFNLLHFSTKDASSSEYIDKAVRFMIKFYEMCEKNKFVLKEGRIQRQIDSFTKQKFVFSDCGAVGCHQVAVLPDESLCICHGDSVDSNLFLGSLRDVDIIDIPKTNQGKKWVSYSTLLDPECLSCPAIFCCGRGCPQHAENLFGSRDSKDYNFCEYVKRVLSWLLLRGYNTITTSDT